MQPAFTAPVMRFIPVLDTDRTIAFYRDILGFEPQPLTDDYGVGATVELVSGAARLQLYPSESFQPSILFFETDDVAKLRSLVSARGAKPTALQKVNWIKMEVFELRDPDGHTLWFGESYNQPARPMPQPMMRQMLPHLPFNDVSKAIAFYRDLVGFGVTYSQDDFAVMDRDGQTLLLISRTEPYKGISSFTVYIVDADAFHAELQGKGANCLGPPVSRPWGLRDFTIEDPEGHRITFAQPFE